MNTSKTPKIGTYSVFLSEDEIMYLTGLLDHESDENPYSADNLPAFFNQLYKKLVSVDFQEMSAIDMLNEMEEGEHHWRTIVERTFPRNEAPYAYVAVLYTWRGTDGEIKLNTFQGSSEDFREAVWDAYHEWKMFGLE